MINVVGIGALSLNFAGGISSFKDLTTAVGTPSDRVCSAGSRTLFNPFGASGSEGDRCVDRHRQRHRHHDRRRRHRCPGLHRCGLVAELRPGHRRLGEYHHDAPSRSTSRPVPPSSTRRAGRRSAVWRTARPITSSPIRPMETRSSSRLTPEDAAAGNAIALDPSQATGSQSLVAPSLIVGATTPVFDLAFAEAGSGGSSFGIAGAITVGLVNNTTQAMGRYGRPDPERRRDRHLGDRRPDADRRRRRCGEVAERRRGHLAGRQRHQPRHRGLYRRGLRQQRRPACPRRRRHDRHRGRADRHRRHDDRRPLVGRDRRGRRRQLFDRHHRPPATTCSHRTPRPRSSNSWGSAPGGRIPHKRSSAPAATSAPVPERRRSVSPPPVPRRSTSSIEENTRAFINDTGTITAGQELAIEAKADSSTWALAGSLAVNTSTRHSSTGLAGAIGVNIVNADDRAFIWRRPRSPLARSTSRPNDPAASGPSPPAPPA